MSQDPTKHTNFDDFTLVGPNDVFSALEEVGIKKGDYVLTHVSLSGLGDHVVGGGQMIIEVLLEVLGSVGTLVMPFHTTNITDPATWVNPPVPQECFEEIREHMPAFDKTKSKPYKLGNTVADFFARSDVSRSNHPLFSFGAIGHHAAEVVFNHRLDNGLGEDSPLSALEKHMRKYC